MIIKRTNGQKGHLTLKKRNLIFGRGWVHTPHTPSGTPLNFPGETPCDDDDDYYHNDDDDDDELFS